MCSHCDTGVCCTSCYAASLSWARRALNLTGGPCQQPEPVQDLTSVGRRRSLSTELPGWCQNAPDPLRVTGVKDLTLCSHVAEDS